MRERGSSLIEVLVASTIVITALVALAQLFVVAITANQRAKTRTQATVLAQEKIEELLEEQAAVASGSDYLDGGGHSMGSGGALPVRAVFVRRWQVQALAIDPGAFVVRVRVTLPMESGETDVAHLVTITTGRLQR